MVTSADTLLDIRNLHVQFPTDHGVVKAVDGVDLTIARGRTVCVVGESGCGKSVTARAILQVIDAPGRITAGSLFFSASPETRVDLAALPPRGRQLRSIRGREIAMIYQEPMSSLSPLYTIGNQISEAIRWHSPVSQQEARQRTIAALEQVGIPQPQELFDRYPFTLSGGMRQRAMIAMALVCSPKLLIADEPTTALDVTTQANILDLLRKLQVELQMSLLWITHDLGVVAEIAHEVAVMYLGKIVEQGTVEQVLHSPNHPYTRALLRSIPRRGAGRLAAIRGNVPSPQQRPGGCLFHTRCDFASTGLCDRVEPAMIQLEDGHSVRCLAYVPHSPLRLEQPPAEAAATDPHLAFSDLPAEGRPVLLAVEQLKVHFPIQRGFFNRTTGHVRAVDGVSFQIYAGETLGLVGESGCGKTTLGHTLMRLYAPTAGEIRYYPRGKADGDTMNPAHLNKRQRKQYPRELRMIFQDPYGSLNPRLSILEIIGEVLKVNNLAQGRELERRVRELMAKVGLSPDYLHRYPHAFSGGQRQRIGIARALAPRPALIVADEPVSALDVSVQAQILNLLKELQSEFSLTYLFISHDLNVVSHISDRVMVMYVGRIVELAPTQTLFQRPQHPYTEALLSAVLSPDPSVRPPRIQLEGGVADPANPPAGCAFHPRCRYAQDRCRHETPALRPVTSVHWVACHFAEELTLHPMALAVSTLQTQESDRP